MKDGGPAFPVLHSIDGNWVKEPLAEFRGMSLRDYFAVHGDQPGQLEIASAAGVLVQEHSTFKYGAPERLKLPLWHEWFNSLSQEERLKLYAKVRYQIADAMLAEREKS